MDSKDIQIFVCKAVKFSVNIFSRSVQKYPVVFAVFSLLFILYFFLPSVFYVLLYSIPFVVCTLVFIYFYFFAKPPGIKNAETLHARQAPLEKTEADVVKVNRDVNFPVQSRNVKGEDKDFDVQASKDKLVAKSLTDDSTRETCLTEEQSRVVTNNRGTSSSQNDPDGENSSEIRKGSGANSVEQASKSPSGGEVEIESSSSGEDEDGEVREGTNKAVEWTEDDQKNLMDLGISEMERNKRLESLIARRRARKSKNPIHKILNMNNGHPLAPVAQVLIARSNPFDIPSCSGEASPGSAPSVLLQTRNPFDLPYDPYEEKPDLTEDGFLQEFMPAHQKDMFFCRHQSFLLGPSFPVLDIIQNEHEGLGFSRLKRTFDNSDHDREVGDPLFGGGEPLRRTISVTDLVTEDGESFEQALNKAEGSDNDDKVEDTNDMKLNLDLGNEFHKAMDLAKPKKNGSSSSGSDDDDDQEGIFDGNTIGITENIHVSGFEFPEVLHNPGHTPLPCPIPKGRVIGEFAYDNLPSPIDKPRVQDLSFLGTKASWHTPTNSIASDMQVEVSELGSPPSMADGTGSSCDADSLTYEADIDKEVTSCSDDIWGVLQDQSISKQKHEASEDDATREQLLYIQRELDNPIASFLQPLSSSTTEEPSEFHRVAEAVDDKTSNSSNTIEINNSSEGNHLTIEPINHDIVEKPREQFNLFDNHSKEGMENNGVEDMRTTEVGIHGNEKSFNEKSLTPHELANLSQVADENTPESVNATEQSFPDKIADEGRITRTENEPIFNENDHIEDLILKEDHNVATEKSDQQEAKADLSETAQERSSEINKTVESNSSEPENSSTTLPFTMPTEYEDNRNIPNPIEGENVSSSHHDNEEEESNREVAGSSLSQMSNNSTTQLDLLVEQVSTNSSTSDSPKSVLPEISPRDQITSPVFAQQMDTPILESDQQSEVRNGSTDGHVHESSDLVSSEKTQDVIDTSIHQPHVSGSETFEEPPDISDNSISEVNDRNVMNRTVFYEEEAKEDTRSNEASNTEFNAELYKKSEETNTRPAELIESNLVANPADTREEENYLHSQNPTPQAKITYNVNEPLTSEITSNEKLTSPGNSVDGEHDSNKPEAIMELSEASEIKNSEPTKDTQDTIKDSKEDAVNDIPSSLLVNGINSSTDHTINSDNRGNETDADKSGEVNDNSKFAEDVKEGDHRSQIEEKTDMVTDSNKIESEVERFQSETSNGLS